MKKYPLIILSLLILFANSANAKYLKVVCKSGDGIYSLLQNYKLDDTDYYFNKFKELNPKKIKKNGELYKGLKYNLPIKVCRFNGESIRTSLDINDFNVALKIQQYNESLLKSNIIAKNFRKSKVLYVPLKYIQNSTTQSDSPANTKNVKILNNGLENVEVKDHTMKDRVFYLSPGHGGPDPGAMGIKDGYELCEDEYAYDITMRLAKCLKEHDATVYVIIRDKNDGIRNKKYLTCDNDETYINGETIEGNQTTRLLKRASIVNSLYEKHKKAKSQTVLMIHVDSRYQEKRIDIFYYYNKGSVAGKKLANTIYKTVKQKYESNQPGRGYYGTISSRELLELRKTKPVGVYIELGNIQNVNDQIRFIDPNNRQAIANWLYLGLQKGTK